MLNFNYIFENRTAVFHNLEEFGFLKNNEIYTYSVKIVDNMFLLTVNITKQNNITIILQDIKFKKIFTDINKINDCYLKRCLEDECEYHLNLINEICFIPNEFKSNIANQIIQHISKTYKDCLNFYWEDINITNKAIFENEPTGRTYAALQKISTKTLGLKEDRVVEILCLKLPREQAQKLIDNKTFFCPHNMNKEYWISILLENVNLQTLKPLIEISYCLARDDKFDNEDDFNFLQEKAICFYKSYQTLCKLISTTNTQICLVK